MGLSLQDIVIHSLYDALSDLLVCCLDEPTKELIIEKGHAVIFHKLSNVLSLHSLKFLWSLLEGRGGLHNFLDDKINWMYEVIRTVWYDDEIFVVVFNKTNSCFPKAKVSTQKKCNFLLCHEEGLLDQIFFRNRGKTMSEFVLVEEFIEDDQVESKIQ